MPRWPGKPDDDTDDPPADHGQTPPAQSSPTPLSTASTHTDRANDPTDPSRATDPAHQPPPTGSHPTEHGGALPPGPPATPPADQLTPADAVNDGDGQDPPPAEHKDDADTDDEPASRRHRMARRLVLLPVKTEATGDAPCIPDLLGVKGIEIMSIQQDYRDCCKVIARGDAAALDRLQDKSRAHFADLWPDPNERERRAALDTDD